MLVMWIKGSARALVGTPYSKVFITPSIKSNYFWLLKICFLIIFVFSYKPLATYESGIASYKNFYFNATTNTLKIWCLTIVGIISLYESVKYLVKLTLVAQCRHSMVVLFMLGIFAHYYAFWAYVKWVGHCIT